MSKRYVIELEDQPFIGPGGAVVWRAKGFNALVFDANGLERLEAADEKAFETARAEAYRDGKIHARKEIEYRLRRALEGDRE